MVLEYLDMPFALRFPMDCSLVNTRHDRMRAREPSPPFPRTSQFGQRFAGQNEEVSLLVALPQRQNRQQRECIPTQTKQQHQDTDRRAIHCRHVLSAHERSHLAYQNNAQANAKTRDNLYFLYRLVNSQNALRSTSA